MGFNFCDTEEEKEIELFQHRHFGSKLSPQYFIQVVCDAWLGCETVFPVSFRRFVLPKKIPYPTVLLDVQPLPVTALRNPAYEALYQELKDFNPLQTEVFNVLYNSDDNVLVAAPMGSGKIICSEFAILRNHRKGGFMRTVYIAPRDTLAKERYSDWNKRFGDGIGLRVVQLTGETATDLKLVEGEVIISTPEIWDALSRRWEHVQREVDVFIVDELHLIGGQGGLVLEVIVSRMRYIASLLEKKMRFVGLSTCVVNSKDLGEWIGATSHGLFNFPLGPRAVRLGNNMRDYNPRRDMDDRINSAIAGHVNSGKPAIVYVPSRESVESTVLDFIRLDSGQRSMLSSLSTNELQPFVKSIKEPMLRTTLKYGVGYLHEGMSMTDQDTVKMLFEKGWTRLCFISSSMSRGVPLSKKLVVVMETQPHTDSLEMTMESGNNGAIQRDYCLGNKFLFEAFPVESHLLHFPHNSLDAKVVSHSVDYLTWTFMDKRRAQNPNYYNLDESVSDSQPWRHLYELVKNKLRDLELEASKCAELVKDMLRDLEYSGQLAVNGDLALGM